ncbi:MAG: hypothetical protein GDA46_00020 [Bdellovibrionales bacterium]|nr:hypothetical protein [Bdellovibrionales bacterium]
MDWSSIFQGIVALGVLFSALWFVLGLRISPLEKRLKKIEETLIPIHNFLLKKFKEYMPLSEAKSQKKITDRGYKILRKNNIDIYLEKECGLLRKDFSGKTDPQIFIEASEWIEKEGKEKWVELCLSNNDSSESIKEVFALFILEKIKNQNSR